MMEFFCRLSPGHMFLEVCANDTFVFLCDSVCDTPYCTATDKEWETLFTSRPWFCLFFSAKDAKFFVKSVNNSFCTSKPGIMYTATPTFQVGV